ncbi:O-antigen ligase [Malonomonas rubra DSM 5091]|uniref:O-antigen ligase n=1 Tax=Malonomonas rubra DSM 5091 TaxID=1122189 RepID=A0A1M6KDE3_MALRU|nr:O-antigen ligase family protein [Malonomonas rubra]SHJ56960.1 O-antigen ligase [Malonomonas rubra DSM 5091]
MSLKGYFFIACFFIFSAGSLLFPHLGIYGYLADYCINPADQWYGRPFARMGFRFSFTLAVATLIGIILQRKKLKFGEALLYRQEWYLLFFLLALWLTHFISPETVGRYGATDHPTVKFTKIVIFTLMMTHVITDYKKLSGLFWVLAGAATILGMKAYSIPFGAFSRGRLEGIGGADFAEANFFAAFMAAMLPIIAIQFLRSPWYGKIICLVSGAFTVNAVILCRSRGAFVGLVAGAIISCIFAPQKHRKKIVLLLIVGMIGVVSVTDQTFIDRILTISVDQTEMDESAGSRFRLWEAGTQMFINNPLGIGPGNWYQNIGSYIPEYEGKDSHSTYVKCLAETGILGFSLFAWLVWLSYSNLRRTYKDAVAIGKDELDDFMHFYFAITVSCVILFTCALTITMIYTEILWLLLMLPVCLRRAFDNYLADTKLSL